MRPRQGSQNLETHRGEIGVGVKIAGTHQPSGATNVLPATTWKEITFDTDELGDKIPLHINFKAEGGILSWRWDGEGVNTVAADTRTGDIPCYALFKGEVKLELQAAAESDLEYEIKYV